MNDYSHDDLADVALTLGERLKLQPAALPLDVFDARQQLQDYLAGVLTEMLDKRARVSVGALRPRRTDGSDFLGP